MERMDRIGARQVFLVLLALLVLLPPCAALAHEEGAAAGSSFLTGFLHPIRGVDHVLAMFAIGLWGSQLGMPGIWVLPVAFPLVMALGGALGIAGVPLPGTELGIALSVIALGAIIALNLRPPVAGALGVAAFFAVFHGHAHGAELPGQAGAIAYSAGFVLATGLIHLSGIAVGLVIHLPRGPVLVRVGGGAIALAGVYLLAGLFAA
jgi:urease accessory protein